LLVLAPLALVLACGDAWGRESSFSFVLEDDRGFRVDTRAGTVTKDMIADPDTTIRLELSHGDLKAIERAFRSTHLVDVPEPHPAYPPSPDGSFVISKPSFVWTLDLEMAGVHRHWQWDTARHVRPPTAEWDALHAAVRTIRDVVDQYADYRALPAASGGYE
jgi:hypothetical protein